MTRVFDCFTFSTELDLLEFRLQYLWPVVDRFVVVEAPRTYSGRPKALAFSEARERFTPYLDKVIHVVVDDLPPPDPDRWVPERFQRNAIMRGLADATGSDIVLIGDVDEFPDPSVVAQLDRNLASTARLSLRSAYYRANWEGPRSWPLYRVARVGSLGSPQALREDDPLLSVADAGVHLSYLMPPGDIQRKYRSFAHDELDNDRSRSAAFLEAMQCLAVFAPTRDMLAVAAPSDLNPVQTWLLDQAPRLFDFTPRPVAMRRIGRAWARIRERRSMPDALIWTGDRMLASLAERVCQPEPARDP